MGAVPSVGQVAIRLLQFDRQIFQNYQHDWVANRVKAFAGYVINGAGEYALEVASLLAPRIYEFITIEGAEGAFKQSVENMLEVVMIVYENVGETQQETPVPTADTNLGISAESEVGTDTSTGEPTGETGASLTDAGIDAAATGDSASTSDSTGETGSVDPQA